MTLTLFLLGMIEYALAAAWTKSVSNKQPLVCAMLSFVSVTVWGLVVTSVAAGTWQMLVAHALGCAVGAGLTVKLSR